MKKKTKYINFRELRDRLDFASILKDADVTLKIKKGNQHQGFCPLPEHEGEKKSPSFSANLDKGIFQCFGCGRKGNLLDFSVLMEGLDPKNGKDVLTIAKKLEKAYLHEKREEESESDVPTKKMPDDESKPEENPVAVVVNKPLDFDLKNLEPHHEYLKERGIERETTTVFGGGYCSRGFMKGRIAIPLHNSLGELIGYAGRIVDDERIDETTPKYLFPPKREKDGVLYEFRKLEFLYNAHRLDPPLESLIVVEGFFDAWKLHQLGYFNVVALMGSSMGEKQCALICELIDDDGIICLMPDGDKAGERLALEAVPEIAKHRLVRWAQLDYNVDPGNADEELIAFLLP